MGRCRHLWVLSSHESELRWFGAVAVLAVLVCFSATTHAQVFKCTDERGKLSFSDKPCADGSGEVLSKYSNAPSTKVSGNAERNGTIQTYVDGFAYWREPGSELVAVLMPRKLTSEEISDIEAGRLSQLQQWRELGLAEITFSFNESETSRANIQHLRSVFTGFDADNSLIPWTSNHSEKELRRRVREFQIVRDGVSQPWLRAATSETSEFISWELTFTVRILR